MGDVLREGFNFEKEKKEFLEIYKDLYENAEQLAETYTKVKQHFIEVTLLKEKFEEDYPEFKYKFPLFATYGFIHSINDDTVEMGLGSEVTGRGEELKVLLEAIFREDPTIVALVKEALKEVAIESNPFLSALLAMVNGELDGVSEAKEEKEIKPRIGLDISDEGMKAMHKKIPDA